MIKKLISGGQTGADRAGLDFAIKYGIPHGGYCPRGRIAEDGTIPEHYRLEETPSAKYEVRTERNVQSADVTVLVTTTPKLSRGSKLTATIATKLGKPLIHLYCAQPLQGAAVDLAEFFLRQDASTVNIAGSRARGRTDVYDFTFRLLESTLSFF